MIELVTFLALWAAVWFFFYNLAWEIQYYCLARKYRKIMDKMFKKEE